MAISDRRARKEKSHQVVYRIQEKVLLRRGGGEEVEQISIRRVEGRGKGELVLGSSKREGNCHQCLFIPGGKERPKEGGEKPHPLFRVIDAEEKRGGYRTISMQRGKGRGKSFGFFDDPPEKKNSSTSGGRKRKVVDSEGSGGERRPCSFP